jgi:enoyl-[acyl-carrier-protein] reductase (NADH)
MFSLAGQKALVVGVANEHSIAWGCAKALKTQGADIALTWLNESAERYVQPLAEELLFGKLVHGGEVNVRMKDGALSFEITPAPPKKGKKGGKTGAKAGA